MILRYLRKTSHVCLVYDKSRDVSEIIVGYVEDLNRRSLTRYVFTLCGSVINWITTLQFIIILSTTKA